MDKARRRELVEAYKEAKPQRGVFAVRCQATGEVWTGIARDLDKQQNREWFALRQRGHGNKALQALWDVHGPDAFTFEALEAVGGEDLTPAGLADRLKDRELEWRESLGARKVAG
ncbi:MAG TPA: GIY-YIG nuclease family protein [Caulobacteraceae bacterium]|nr:GIY-YIG nuclease family protein [Caulobacteraceae bacterium]